MKILFVLTYYRPHWTGLTQYAARLAEGLAIRGHQVEVLCSQHDKKLPLNEEIGQVKVFRLPFLFKFLRSVIMPNFPLKLWERVKENEVIVVYLPLQEAILVALVCKILRKKLFLVHNGDLVLPEKGGLFNRLIEKIYYFTTSSSICLSDGIVVQTEDYSKNSKLLLKYKEKWRIILPLYEISEITTKEVADFLRNHKLENKNLIGFSGRLVEEKGVDYLLQAIPLVTKKLPNSHFVFAGEPKIKYERFWEKIQPLINQNKEKITLLGVLKDPKEMFSFYKSLAVYVQPSRTDCFPSSLVEALLSETPCVCTNIPGARWSVSQTGMGEVVKPKNPEALVEGIIKVLKNREKYLVNFPKVKKIFDYQKTLGNYERLFEKG